MIHLAGRGEAGPNGGEPGDVYIKLQVREHEHFRREGNNLELVVPIPMTAAALGTSVEVPTLEADLGDREDMADAPKTLEVEVPAGTQSGTRVAIAGRGVPKLRGRGRGELGVTFLVQTPTKINKEQRELLEQLAELRRRPGATALGWRQGLLRAVEAVRPVTDAVFLAAEAATVGPGASLLLTGRRVTMPRWSGGCASAR